MYRLNTNEVNIEDSGSVISVINKKTGQRMTAKNYCGYTNGKLYFVIIYEGEPNRTNDIVQGRVNALSEILKRLGLPSYRTLKRHAMKQGEMNLQ